MSSINVVEGSIGDIVVITDAIPESVFRSGGVMTDVAMKLFLRQAKICGFGPERFTFITPCPPISIDLDGSESRIGNFVSEYREGFLQELQPLLEGAKVILPLGKIGNRQLAGKSVQITKARGTFITSLSTGDIPVLPLLAPYHVLRRPELKEIYESDFRQIKDLQDKGWDLDEYGRRDYSEGYSWCSDIQYIIDDPPKSLALDCETVGVDHYSSTFRVLTVSITTKKGTAVVIPLDVDYVRDSSLSSEDTPSWFSSYTVDDRDRLIGQLKELLAMDIAVAGHNLKFDIHALNTLDIEVANWYADTMQLAFVADENMMSKSLDDCVRRWVPSMAGYADDFNKTTNKSRMQDVPFNKMLEYAGGDTDATYRLANALLPIAKEDEEQWNCFLKVQMPSLRAFLKMEQEGINIDVDSLRRLEQELTNREKEMYDELIEEVPAPVLRKHIGAWSFTRQKFVVDILFGEEGIRDSEGNRLEPIMFTKATKNLPDGEKVPSTSAKGHLPYFEHIPFVRKLTQYFKLAKMRSTYVGSEGSEVVIPVKRLKSGALPSRVKSALDVAGISYCSITNLKRLRRPYMDLTDVPYTAGKCLRVDECGNVYEVMTSEPSGFWRYIQENPVIHSSFHLHRTVTGRTASSDPNLQNIPKRGDMAKSFRKVFVPPEGYVFMEADYSQVELRVAAWEANEHNMIRIYRERGDIHSATAAAIMGVSESDFLAGRSDRTLLTECYEDWPNSDKYLRSLTADERSHITVKDYCDLKRFQAKSVAFGYLYGMWWKGFKVYAKTEYGIEYSDEEAKSTREEFFTKYPALSKWHRDRKREVRRNGYVRGLHGALRRLPNILSFDEGIQGNSERQAINSTVQRFASDLGLISLIRLSRDAPTDLMRPLMFIHDAVVLAVKEDRVQEAAESVKYYMENPPLMEWFGIESPFPMIADVSVGSNLGDMDEIEVEEAVKPSWFEQRSNS
tara:strand:+ start:6895 stop:9777 length:2883 start_codon:yes stop_codon:yes gene_type:complete